jgi:hypothetical protein
MEAMIVDSMSSNAGHEPLHLLLFPMAIVVSKEKSALMNISRRQGLPGERQG